MEQIGLWLSDNLIAIGAFLSTLTIGGISFSVVGAFLSKFALKITSKVSNTDDLVTKRMDELEKQNEVILRYVKTSAEANSHSTVLSEADKAEFAGIASDANSFIDKFKDIVETIKGKF